jgi:hypothetical protein
MRVQQPVGAPGHHGFRDAGPVLDRARRRDPRSHRLVHGSQQAVDRHVGDLAVRGNQAGLVPGVGYRGGDVEAPPDPFTCCKVRHARDVDAGGVGEVREIIVSQFGGGLPGQHLGRPRHCVVVLGRGGTERHD